MTTGKKKEKNTGINRIAYRRESKDSRTDNEIPPPSHPTHDVTRTTLPFPPKVPFLPPAASAPPSGAVGGVEAEGRRRVLL